MHTYVHSSRLGIACGVTAVVLLFVVGIAAQETVLHTFHGNDGNEPIASLIADASGNLYGTTFYGGANDVGTVYELKRNSNGTWSEKVLHSFKLDGIDGFSTTASLTMDNAGNLYGTTFFGGTAGFGTVFELSPVGNGTWTEKVLHSFLNNSTDGAFPRSGVILDSSGNLYGTTPNGGPKNFGTVYELSPAGNGTWTETVLHLFLGSDGANPFGALVFDSNGNLYGTAATGGGSTSACKFGCGLIFELKKGSGGSWTEQILHNFTLTKNDGAFPYGALTFDQAGNLYGTTNGGGPASNGTVFELTHSGSGWREKQLYAFTASHDGTYPTPTVVLDGSGNLYGATQGGGSSDKGTVFELMPGGSGTWVETILYSFTNTGTGGYAPAQSPILDSAGNVYGTVISGGAGFGTAYEIKLP